MFWWRCQMFVVVRSWCCEFACIVFCVLYQDKSKDSVFGGDYSTLDRLDTTSTNSESKVRVVDEHGSEIDYDDDIDDRMKKVPAFEWPRHFPPIVSFAKKNY